MCSPLGHSSPIHPKHTSPPPFPPSPALSAMNMDRFEKGPREILNPEIQKVRLASAVWFFFRAEPDLQRPNCTLPLRLDC